MSAGRLKTRGLEENGLQGRSQVKPLKSQLKPELRYYPVTLFKTATGVLGGFQHAELQARFGGLRLQM